jgi:hypothetical protein
MLAVYFSLCFKACPVQSVLLINSMQKILKGSKTCWFELGNLCAFTDTVQLSCQNRANRRKTITILIFYALKWAITLLIISSATAS